LIQPPTRQASAVLLLPRKEQWPVALALPDELSGGREEQLSREAWLARKEQPLGQEA
jgi:hypothetical protein